MLWTEGTLRKVAAEEATRVLKLPESKSVLETQILETLRQDAVRRTIQVIGSEEFMAEQRDAIVTDFRQRIEFLVKELELSAQSRSNVISTQMISSMEDRVDEKRKSIVKRFEEKLKSLTEKYEAELSTVEEKLLSRVESMIRKGLDQKLDQAVAEFVRQRPRSQPDATNREIAHRNGVSIREAKRARRLAYESDVTVDEAIRQTRERRQRTHRTSTLGAI